MLRGKHKPIFAPHLDTGDHVIVVNASKVVLTSGKADREHVYRYSGYPGGLKQETYAELLARKPEEAIRRSVRGMLPKGPLGRQMLKKLKVYAGPEHPHAAQGPVLAGAAPGQGSLSAREDEIVTKPLTQTTGRRKQAVARVRLRPGTGAITVNRRPFEDYFPVATHRMLSSEALRVTSTEEVYDVDATLDGGGISGQAGALRLGIARASDRARSRDAGHAQAGRSPDAATRARRRARRPASRRPARRRSTPSADPPGPHMALRFGTDGVRGVANAELTPELALVLGRAAARVLGVRIAW